MRIRPADRLPRAAVAGVHFPVAQPPLPYQTVTYYTTDSFDSLNRICEPGSPGRGSICELLSKMLRLGSLSEAQCGSDGYEKEPRVGSVRPVVTRLYALRATGFYGGIERCGCRHSLWLFSQRSHVGRSIDSHLHCQRRGRSACAKRPSNWMLHGYESVGFQRRFQRED